MSIKGTVTLPGDKSLSHRALIFAAMSNGESQISNLSDGNDVMSTRECLEHCGIKIFDQNDQLVVTLGTFISSDAFSLPWTVPSGFDTGTYTITATDGANTASFEIFIQ